MGIELFDPVGEVKVARGETTRALDTLRGKVVGYVFNQHLTTVAFWSTLEQSVESKFKPSRTLRVYKPNLSAPAPKQEVERLIRETDYALVGVGA
ncbi:MAG: hypothetical protein HYX89_06295 [Chloroflexi bacterium]|nr:hypothetical protein [Chloroflexota bacterium]